jgi:membrane-associated phospholipid phosphatase
MCRLVIPFITLAFVFNSYSLTQTNVNYSTVDLPSIILPVTLVGVGILSFYNHNIDKMNYGIQDEFVEQNYPYTHFDDIFQYVPMASVYGLNILGIRGLHDFNERTMLAGSSYALMVVTVRGLKNLTKEERPDKSDFKSFPSGHTAMAFVGAECVWQEYRDVSVWYGITAYSLAAGTGIFRMYNNKHWFTDVCAGAGIGMLCTKFTYTLYPYIMKIFNRNVNYQQRVAITPLTESDYYGLGCSIKF